MARPVKKIGKQKFQQALSELGYDSMLVQKHLKISRDMFYRYLRDYELRQFYYDGKELERLQIVGMAAGKLFKKVKEGYWPAVQYALSRLDKEHYAEKQIIEQTNMEVIKPKKKK